MQMLSKVEFDLLKMEIESILYRLSIIGEGFETKQDQIRFVISMLMLMDKEGKQSNANGEEGYR